MSTLYDQSGHRKYLTPAEGDAFLKATEGCGSAGGAYPPRQRTNAEVVGLEPLESLVVGCGIIDAAKIAGSHATPKELRHAFRIKGVISGVPLNTLQ
jgi:hypothetical protein